jgi:hypothetical protein
LPDDPTLRELEQLIKRNFTDGRDDILDLKSQVQEHIRQLGTQMQQYLLVAVYQAEKEATRAREDAYVARIVRLETEATARARGNRAAFWAAGGAVLAAVVGAVMAYLLAKGGGAH